MGGNYTGNRVTRIRFDFEGEIRDVDLAQEAMIDKDNPNEALAEDGAKKTYWSSVLAHLRKKAELAESKRQYIKAFETERIRVERTVKKDKVTEELLKNLVRTGTDYIAAVEDVAAKWELVDAVEGLVKALYGKKARSDALQYFAERSINGVITVEERASRRGESEDALRKASGTKSKKKKTVTKKS